MSIFPTSTADERRSRAGRVSRGPSSQTLANKAPAYLLHSADDMLERDLGSGLQTPTSLPGSRSLRAATAGGVAWPEALIKCLPCLK